MSTRETVEEPDGDAHEREIDQLANDLASEWRERAERAEAEVTLWKTRLVEETARLRAALRSARES
jgi:molecular chaperone GrpE (heat shock protein)